MKLTDHFDLSEFAAVSDVTLDVAMVEKAARFARMLEPARVALGAPILVTSFIRSGYDPHAVSSAPHARGDSLDFVPSPATGSATRALRDWLDQHVDYGELLYEITPLHLHMTLPGFRGDYMQALDEDPDNPNHWLTRAVNAVAHVTTTYQNPILATLFVALLVLVALKGRAK